MRILMTFSVQLKELLEKSQQKKSTKVEKFTGTSAYMLRIEDGYKFKIKSEGKKRNETYYTEDSAQNNKHSSGVFIRHSL